MVEASSGGTRPTAWGVSASRIASGWSRGAGAGIGVLLDGAFILVVALLTTSKTKLPLKLVCDQLGYWELHPMALDLHWDGQQNLGVEQETDSSTTGMQALAGWRGTLGC